MLAGSQHSCFDQDTLTLPPWPLLFLLFHTHTLFDNSCALSLAGLIIHTYSNTHTHTNTLAHVLWELGVTDRQTPQEYCQMAIRL